MNSKQIDSIVAKLAEISNQNYNYFDLKETFPENLNYNSSEIGRFIDHLLEKGQRINLSILKNHIKIDELAQLINTANFPILVFRKLGTDDFEPIVIYKDKKEQIVYHSFATDALLPLQQEQNILNNLLLYENYPDVTLEGSVIFLTVLPLEYIATDYYGKASGDTKDLTPIRRLFRLLRTERKEITYSYIYAFAVSIINLSLPLGIQATVSLISGGMFFSSVIVLIALIIVGIILSGALQVMQITIVEVLQQRVFSKSAFELAFRMNKIRAESLAKYYPPELMNRFFDVVTIQKGLPKIFVDISAAVFQIFLGLFLLSLYHPVFLIFSVLLMTFILLIFSFTGKKGLKTSSMESKYKYKVAYWLEELARTVGAFKQAGNTNLPIQKMDELISSYLYYRKAHFRVLLTQFFNVLLFKVLVTGGLLIIGTALVVERQITLGQFVASEVIIILVVGSVEKLIMSLDVIYDTLTGMDKIGNMTDLPLERNDGTRIALDQNPKGLQINAKGLKFKYENNPNYTLQGIDFEISAGESVCIAGHNDSGKHTLAKILAGNLDTFEGAVTMNNFPLRNIDLNNVRDAVSKTLDQDEIFDGTILDNITMGRTYITYNDVIWAIHNVGLRDYIAGLKDGLYTHIGATGKRLSSSVTTRLLLARSVASKPKLLIINDFSEHITKSEKMKILSFLQDKENGWTLIILSVSDDPVLFSSCDKIVLLSEGKVAALGSYDELLGNKTFQNLVFKNR
jgi:ABC-type bacteriocin/lantibiotic exporter with double-glycine peptidase domain